MIRKQNEKFLIHLDAFILHLQCICAQHDLLWRNQHGYPEADYLCSRMCCGKKNRCFAISVICKQQTLLQKKRIWSLVSFSQLVWLEMNKSFGFGFFFCFILFLTYASLLLQWLFLHTICPNNFTSLLFISIPQMFFSFCFYVFLHSSTVHISLKQPLPSLLIPHTQGYLINL